MKLLVVGPQFPDSFARNVSVTLRAMGHEVGVIEGTRFRHHGARLTNLWWTYAPRGFPSIERRVFRRVVKAARRLQPDLVLVTYGIMPPEVVYDLKGACGGKVVCWFTDAVTSLYRHYLLAGPFDAVFLKEPFLVRVFRDKLGLNAFYLPECCNPIWHRRVDLSEADRRKYGCDLAALGGLHYYRARMLEPFADYSLKIWGRSRPSWLASPTGVRYTNHFVAEGEKAKALLSARVIVNTMNCAEIEGVNCALFEAAGCGAFQIADWKPTLPDQFEPEHEIVTFRTRQELKEKVDYYLAHPSERQEIAGRAYARAHREHTYELRLSEMFRLLRLVPQSEATPEGVVLQAT